MGCLSLGTVTGLRELMWTTEGIVGDHSMAGPVLGSETEGHEPTLADTPSPAMLSSFCPPLLERASRILLYGTGRHQFR